MRTIKFRGKFNSIRAAVKPKNDGSWVYGDLVHNIIFSEGKLCDAIHDGSEFVPVNSATVGQFTGLLDKNGKEIYEGDILKAGDVGLLEVRFVRGVFAFLWNGNLDDEFSTGSPTHEWANVISNIHDNPKLLGGGEQ